MEKYCIKIYCNNEEYDLVKNQGLRYLVKETEGPYTIIILFSDELDSLFDVFSLYYSYENDIEPDDVCESFDDYVRLVYELPVSYFEGFN